MRSATEVRSGAFLSMLAPSQLELSFSSSIQATSFASPVIPFRYRRCGSVRKSPLRNNHEGYARITPRSLWSGSGVVGRPGRTHRGTGASAGRGGAGSFLAMAECAKFHVDFQHDTT